MKIKVTTPNYTAFTGWIGDVQFDEGTSVSDVSEAQVNFISAMHTVEMVDGDAPVKEVTPTEQEQGESAPETAEVPSEEQKAETPEQAEQAEESADAAKG